MTDVWTYRTGLGDTTDLEGFDVHATDGDIGSIDEATYDVGACMSSSTPDRGSSARRC
jgi:hypothetical protein